jgi:hypothetical protein
VPARSTIEYELPMEPLKQNAYVLRASAPARAARNDFWPGNNESKPISGISC